LRRVGKKKMPLYHIVAADSRASAGGKFLEIVGRYEPRSTPMVIRAEEAKVIRWLRNGAQPTETVRSLFQRSGLWYKWSMVRKGKDEATILTEMQKWEMAQGQKRERELARKQRRLAARRQARKGGTETPAATAPAAG
jgi:small subunit ribosomal protein S16